MIIDVYMRSGNIGSNPGGTCNIVLPNRPMIESYLKYAIGSELSRVAYLRPEHQPVYEAVTFALVRAFGLATSEDVLLRGESLNVFYLPAYKGPELQSGRKFYFTSRLLKGNEGKDQDRLVILLAREKIYRDFALLHDVSKKWQNIFFPEEEDRVVYLDLGCSFVDCVDGRLRQLNMVRKLNLERNSLRQCKKELDKTNIITGDGREINLGMLVESIPETTIAIHGEHAKQVKQLLPLDEIEYISGVYTTHMAQTVRDYKSDGRIMKGRSR